MDVINVGNNFTRAMNIEPQRTVSVNIQITRVFLAFIMFFISHAILLFRGQ